MIKVLDGVSLSMTGDRYQFNTKSMTNGKMAELV